MTTTTVWRVECPCCGAGPYSFNYRGHHAEAKQITRDMLADHDNKSHPAPWEDIPGVHPSELWEEVCGTATAEALRAWFGQWLPDLVRLGFEVTTWEVEEKHVRRGKKQVMFHRDRATRLATPPDIL